MKSVKGDLIRLALDGHFDVIIHGCNCFNTMGAGIARSIKQAFPEACHADLATMKGDRNKLGTISVAEIIRGSTKIKVVNAYTQYDYRGRSRKVDYEAIRSCFQLIVDTFPSSKIGYPLIGAGLAGGDWGVISEIIEETLFGLDHTLVIYSPE